MGRSEPEDSPRDLQGGCLALKRVSVGVGGQVAVFGCGEGRRAAGESKCC